MKNDFVWATLSVVLGMISLIPLRAGAETCPMSSDGAFVIDPWEPSERFSSAAAVGTLPDGNLLVAGSVRKSDTGAGPCASDTCFAVVRYQPDGCRDISYGSGGIVAPVLGAAADYGYALAVLSDGRAVVAGSSNLTGKTFEENLSVARFTSNGALDSSFGFSGYNTLDISRRRDVARAVGIQSMGFNAGKIVVAGESENMRLAAGTAIDSVVARFTANGAIDTGIGGFGQISAGRRVGYRLVNVRSGYDDRIWGLAVQPDDRIVAVGGWSDPNFFGQMVLMRLTADGNLDGTFGSGGISMPALGGAGVRTELFAVALQGDGKIVASGRSTENGPGDDFLVARFLPDGSLDTGSFNAPKGYQVIDLGTYADLAKSVVIQPDGKILAGGNANFSFAVVRFNSDGSRDASFGSNGVKISSSTGDVLWGFSLALGSTGDITMVGERRSPAGGTVNPTLVRFWP